MTLSADVGRGAAGPVLESTLTPPPAAGLAACRGAQLAGRRRDGAAGDRRCRSRPGRGRRLTVAARAAPWRRCSRWCPASRRGRAGRSAVRGPRERPYDAALLLTNSFHSALTVWRAGIPERWGYRRDFRGPLLTRAIAPPDRSAPGGVLSAPGSSARLSPADRSNRALERHAGDLAGRAGELLAERGWDGAAAARWPSRQAPPTASAKRWPAASFAAGRAMRFRQMAWARCSIGSPADRAAGDEVSAWLGPDGASSISSARPICRRSPACSPMPRARLERLGRDALWPRRSACRSP